MYQDEEEGMGEAPLQEDLIHRLLENKRVRGLLEKIKDPETASVLVEMLEAMEKAIGRDLIAASDSELVSVREAMKVVVGLNQRLKRLLSIKKAAKEKQENDISNLGEKRKRNGHW